MRKYFIDRPPMGSYFASNSYRKNRQHKVSSGESLSVLAQRYNISVNKLKTANSLSSNTVKIGQTLKIPSAD